MNDTQFSGWRKSRRSNSSGDCVEVGTGWRKSYRSNSSGNCVEVQASAGRRMIGVRDSKQHARGPVLEFPASTWGAFVSTIRGEKAGQ
jgi:hypothetical protein